MYRRTAGFRAAGSLTCGGGRERADRRRRRHEFAIPRKWRGHGRPLPGLRLCRNTEKAEIGPREPSGRRSNWPRSTRSPRPGDDRPGERISQAAQDASRRCFCEADGVGGVLVRGDHETSRARSAPLGAAPELARRDRAGTGALVGFAGPVGMAEKIPSTPVRRGGNRQRFRVTGANAAGPLTGVNPGRLRAGAVWRSALTPSRRSCPRCSSRLTIRQAIEVACLQARHEVFRGAGRSLPGLQGAAPPDHHGLLRDRRGADSGRPDRDEP